MFARNKDPRDDDRVGSQSGGGPPFELESAECRGISGDNSRLSLVDSVVGSFSVSCLFRMLEDGFQWAFTGVYGPVKNSFREAFWEELGSIKGLWDGPWGIGGDFNEVLFPNERDRGGRLSNSMRRFSDIMNDLDLSDLSLQGGPYTWSGGLNGSSMSRLDRFLVTAVWESYCNKVT